MHNNGENYLFQLAKNKRLTAIYHSHDFYELVCFLRGDAVQTVNGEKLSFRENDVLILTPGDSHSFFSQSDDIEIISLSVKREEFEAFLLAFGLEGIDLPECFVFPRVAKLTDMLIQGQSVEECDCRLLLSAILRAYLKNKSAGEEKNTIPKVLLFAAEEMKKAENLRSGISAFAALSNYSQSHLSRLVKKHFGMGLKEYVNDLRLRRAYDELVLTDEPCDIISESLGFSSYSHFYRIFKARYSLSPKEVRCGFRA